MTATALEKAFSNVGVNRNDVQFRAAVARYINNGGSYERATNIIQELSGKGQHLGGKTLGSIANAWQPNGARRANRSLPREARLELPAAPNFERSGASMAQRSATNSVKQAAAKSVLDLVKTCDGRAWGDVGAHELDGMDRDGALARAVKIKIGVLTNSDRFKKLRDLMTAKQFEEARKVAASG